MDDGYNYLPFEIDKTQYAVPLEYVAYIISAAEQYPWCTLPKQNRCVSRVMWVGEELVTIVELTDLWNTLTSNGTQSQRTMLLVLNYCNHLIGVLTDRISHPIESYDEKYVSSFDVPDFYNTLQNRDYNVQRLQQS